MILETPEQEKQHANTIISNTLKDREDYLVNILSQVKDVKKQIRKLKKQEICEHDFKIKVIPSSADHYKCKKCKFEFLNYPE